MKAMKIRLSCSFSNSLLSFFLLTSSVTFAQPQGGYRPHPLLSPMWQADVEYLDPTQVEDTTMENGFAGLGFTYRLPLYTGKDWLSADGGKPFYAILAQVGATARQSQIDFLEPDRLLTLGRIGVTGLMAKGLRNLYLVNISVSMPSESFRFSPGYLRPHGALVWRKLYHNNTFWHTLGVIYTPIRGRDLPLPLVGAGVKLGNYDQLQFTFPFNLAYTHRFNRHFSLTGRIQNMGGYHYLQADSIYRDEPLLYRFRYPRLGIMGRIYTMTHVVITPEIALTGRGKLQIGENKFYQTNSLFFRLSVQVRFGKRPSAAPILNFDPGDSGFDPAYLVE
jgi:hypothetical protein